MRELRRGTHAGDAGPGGARDSTGPAARGPTRESVDYKAILAPADFEVFARLRALRKVIAERDGVPPYAVFSNEQLAAIARARPERASRPSAACPGSARRGWRSTGRRSWPSSRPRWPRRRVLALCDRIIAAHAASPGCGLPIGALTSQHFANYYLAPLDRIILEGLRAPAMVVCV